jgi:hypothetical protein
MVCNADEVVQYAFVAVRTQVNRAIIHVDKEMGLIDACRAKLTADLRDKVRHAYPAGEHTSRRQQNLQCKQIKPIPHSPH